MSAYLDKMHDQRMAYAFAKARAKAVYEVTHKVRNSVGVRVADRFLRATGDRVKDRVLLRAWGRLN